MFVLITYDIGEKRVGKVCKKLRECCGGFRTGINQVGRRNEVTYFGGLGVGKCYKMIVDLADFKWIFLL
jgi:hypothetical protein